MKIWWYLASWMGVLVFPWQMSLAIENYKTVATIVNPISDVSKKLENQFKDALNSEILITKRFRLVSDEIVSSYVSILKRSKKEVSVQNMQQLIQNYDIDAIFVVDMDKIKDGRIVTTLRMLDARNEQIVAFENDIFSASPVSEFKQSQEVDMFVRELYFRILNVLPYQAAVISVNGKFITIDAGRILKLKNGDFLKIVRVQNVTRSPGVGDVVTPEIMDLGTIKLVDAKDEVALGVIVSSKEGVEIKVDDKVLLHGLDFQKYFDRKFQMYSQLKNLAGDKNTPHTPVSADKNAAEQGQGHVKSVPLQSFSKQLEDRKNIKNSNNQGVAVAESKEGSGVAETDFFPSTVNHVGNVGMTTGLMLYFYEIHSRYFEATLSDPGSMVNSFHLFGEYQVIDNLVAGADIMYGKSTLDFAKNKVDATVKNFRVRLKYRFRLDLFGGGAGLLTMPVVAFSNQSIVGSPVKSGDKEKAKLVSERRFSTLDMGGIIETALHPKPFSGVYNLRGSVAMLYRIPFGLKDTYFKDLIAGTPSIISLTVGLKASFENLFDLKFDVGYDTFEYKFKGDDSKTVKIVNVSILEQTITTHLGAMYNF